MLTTSQHDTLQTNKYMWSMPMSGLVWWWQRKAVKCLKQNTTLMYSAYNTPRKVHNIVEIEISSNPDYHPKMQAVQIPPRLNRVGIRVTLVRIMFSREGESMCEGCIDPDAGICLVLKEWGNTPTRHTSTEKYISENIYARCQSSVVYLAW